MKCENCIHTKPCGEYQQKFLSHLKNLKVTDCPYYKEKDKVIELPCKVGDTVYVIGTQTKEIIPLTVNGVWACEEEKTIMTKQGMLLTEFYLTKEEAEKALKELKESNSPLLNKENEK